MRYLIKGSEVSYLISEQFKLWKGQFGDKPFFVPEILESGLVLVIITVDI